MKKIRDIKLITQAKEEDVFSKNFEIHFFFKFRKSPIPIYLNTDMSFSDLISALLDFTTRIVSNVDVEE